MPAFGSTTLHTLRRQSHNILVTHRALKHGRVHLGSNEAFFYRASLACRDRELVVDKSIPAHTALYWAAARFKLRLRLGQEVGRQVAPCPSSKPAGMRACGFMPVPRRRIDFVYSTALCSTSMGIKPATVHYRKTKYILGQGRGKGGRTKHACSCQAPTLALCLGPRRNAEESRQLIAWPLVYAQARSLELRIISYLIPLLSTGGTKSFYQRAVHGNCGSPHSIIIEQPQLSIATHDTDYV